MPANVENVTRVTKVTVTGTVENEPPAPFPYSAVKGRKFQPVKFLITYMSKDFGPWQVERWSVVGPGVLKDGRLSENMITSWDSTFRGEISERDREFFPWLADVIEANRPKTG